MKRGDTQKDEAATAKGPSSALLGSIAIAWLCSVLALALPYMDIEAVRRDGSEMILWLQSQGQGLRSLAIGFSLLGDDTAYIAALPMLVVVIPGVGVQAFCLFFISLYTNSVLKTFLHAPRPSWISTAGFVCEIEYGNPSGHSQHAFCLYLFAAYWVSRASSRRGVQIITWLLAILTASGVAISRTIVGAHFPHQVIGGAALGTAMGLSSVALLQTATFMEALRRRVATLHSSTVFAAMLSVAGCSLAVTAWAVSAVTFQFPEAWAERAALACTDGEVIDEFGGVRYAFLAVGMVAALTIAQGARALEQMVEYPGLTMMHKLLMGFASVFAAALLYFGMGACVSKHWHIAVVLTLRYYFRGLVAGLGVLWLLPVVWKMAALCQASDGSFETVSEPMTPEASSCSTKST